MNCDTRTIEPQATKITVPSHVRRRYERRCGGEYADDKIEAMIKLVVVRGRRSDRDKSVLDDLAPFQAKMQLEHSGRPVAVFWHEEVACLVVRESRHSDRLVVLTCFSTATTPDGRPRDASFDGAHVGPGRYKHGKPQRKHRTRRAF